MGGHDFTNGHVSVVLLSPRLSGSGFLSFENNNNNNNLANSIRISFLGPCLRALGPLSTWLNCLRPIRLFSLSRRCLWVFTLFLSNLSDNYFTGSLPSSWAVATKLTFLLVFSFFLSLLVFTLPCFNFLALFPKTCFPEHCPPNIPRS